MAKKAPAKPPAKRKPRPKKPVVPDKIGVETITEYVHVPVPTGSGWIAIPAFCVALVLGIGIGVWIAGGIPIGGDVVPVHDDCLSQAHAADRVSQVAVLRELAAQPFDGTTDDGRRKAGEWFNAQRFRNRADDFGAYTDAVSESIAVNSEAKLADELEAK